MTAGASHGSSARAEPHAPAQAPSSGSPFAAHWSLDPSVAFLNHGSFGACPGPVLEEQRRWRERLEREPVAFMVGELERALDRARGELATFVGCDADDLAFVPNATTGVNTVLRSLDFASGDELLTTDHEYNASRNALDFAAARSGARVVAAPVPFPLKDSQQIVDALLAKVSPRTRLALVDHVTSPTGLVLPIERIVGELQARGIDALVDGAHAPGQVPLRLAQLGAAYYTGNCHKWLCTPKGSALLFVRRDRQARIRPLAISHGANSPRTDRPRFRLEFDFCGTDDFTPYLSVPAAIRFLGSLLPGGWSELMQHNRALALAGRRILCATLRLEPPCPESMLQNLAAVPLPPAPEDQRGRVYEDPLQDALVERHRIQVPVFRIPALGLRVVRISAQIYNHEDQYRHLAEALRAELGLRA